MSTATPADAEARLARLNAVWAKVLDAHDELPPGAVAVQVDAARVAEVRGS